MRSSRFWSAVLFLSAIGAGTAALSQRWLSFGVLVLLELSAAYRMFKAIDMEKKEAA